MPWSIWVFGQPSLNFGYGSSVRCYTFVMLKHWGLTPSALVVAVVFLLGSSGSSFADLIQVKGKTFFNGKIISESDKEIVFEKALGGKKETYALSDVRIIRRDKDTASRSRADTYTPLVTAISPETAAQNLARIKEAEAYKTRMEDNEKKMEDLQRQMTEAVGKMPSISGGIVPVATAQQAYNQAMTIQQLRTEYNQRIVAEMEAGDPPPGPVLYEPPPYHPTPEPQPEDDSSSYDEQQNDESYSSDYHQDDGSYPPYTN